MLLRAFFAVAAAAAAFPAPAHPGQGAESGFLHPLSGGDHVQAMLAVGAWAGVGVRSRTARYLGGLAAAAGMALLGVLA